MPRQQFGDVEGGGGACPPGVERNRPTFWIYLRPRSHSPCSLAPLDHLCSSSPFFCPLLLHSPCQTTGPDSPHFHAWWPLGREHPRAYAGEFQAQVLSSFLFFCVVFLSTLMALLTAHFLSFGTCPGDGMGTRLAGGRFCLQGGGAAPLMS